MSSDGLESPCQMSSPHRDPSRIKGDDLENDPSARVFRAYQDARRRQDDDEAVALWERFVVMGYPLMRNKVARLVGRSDLKWLGYDDVDDVAQEAFLRAKGMALTFDGQA